MALRKALKVFAWFNLTLLLLVIDVFYLSSYVTNKNEASVRTKHLTALRMEINAPSSSGEVLGTSVVGDDARILLVKNFITKNNAESPFLTHTDTIVNEADKNKIDFRLVPAIAMCESNLGKRIPSSDSFNAWGIAVFTGQNNGKKFNDWPHAINWVSSYIREKFFDKGITDLREIGAIWAPPSVEKDYSWTRCVEGFMEEMQ